MNEKEIADLKNSVDNLFGVLNSLQVQMMSMNFLLEYVVETKLNVKREEWSPVVTKRINDLVNQAVMLSYNNNTGVKH